MNLFPVCEECDCYNGQHTTVCSRALSDEDRALLCEQPDTTLRRAGPEREQVPGPRLAAVTAFMADYYRWMESSEGRFAQYYARQHRPSPA